MVTNILCLAVKRFRISFYPIHEPLTLILASCANALAVLYGCGSHGALDALHVDRILRLGRRKYVPMQIKRLVSAVTADNTQRDTERGDMHETLI
jgi:hypothetical protein